MVNLTREQMREIESRDPWLRKRRLERRAENRSLRHTSPTLNGADVDRLVMALTRTLEGYYSGV